MMAALPLQVKVRVCSFPVTTMVSALGGCSVSVGGTIVGRGIGVSEADGSVGRGTGVEVSAAGAVFAGREVGVLEGGCVKAGSDVEVFDTGGSVLVGSGMEVSAAAGGSGFVARGAEGSAGIPVPVGANVSGLAASAVMVSEEVRAMPDGEL
jgi:hypothetical protein